MIGERLIAWGGAILALVSCVNAGAPRFDSVFTDWAVLQRGVPVPVSGWSDPGSEVVVSLAGVERIATAGADGRWAVEFPAPEKTGGDHSLSARSGAAEAEVAHVTFGDLWLCAGQSNMDFPVKRDAGAEELLDRLPKNIRVLKMPPRPSAEAQSGFDTRDTRWRMLSTATAPEVSAVAVYFARNLQPEINVPVGLITATFGGTGIQAWTPRPVVSRLNPQDGSLARREAAVAALAADPRQSATGPNVLLQQGAGTLFDGVINPLAPLRLAGVVWYQGEQNAGGGAAYRNQLPALIGAWRDHFRQPMLPFVLVQLPNYQDKNEGGWAPVREAQMFAAKDSRVALVVSIDQGDAKNIHPPIKSEIGRRVALAARSVVYHHPVEGLCPLPVSFEIRDKEVVVAFKNAESGLEVRGDAGIPGFLIAGADRVFVPAEARIDGKRVTVSAAGIPAPVAVRYLWQDAPPAVALFNKTGLPATPFRTDNWPAVDRSPWFTP